MVRDMFSIFEKVRRRKSPDPLILCDNNDFKEGVLSDTNASNAVAIPAYENDKIFGVLVIVSGNYDFFESGFSFYESCLVDFTGAVQSARLYLQMKDMAIKDGLTGVYNRAYFNEIYPSICAKSIVNEQSLSVALLDIDKFKRINDTYGHLAGDEVIRMVASVDQKYAKMHDGYAVRYGGEEFLLIIQGKTVEEFYAILQQVHDDIVKNIVKFEGEEIKVNSSIGMSNYPEIAEEIVDVLDQSDQAMYFSKEHGRGMIVIFGREEESLPEELWGREFADTEEENTKAETESIKSPEIPAVDELTQKKTNSA
jgi:diguanylate cyclase (GGDEF)-like protein